MKFELSTFKTVASCSIMMLTNLSLSGQTKFSFDEKALKRSEALLAVEYKQITDSSGTRNAYMLLIDQEIPIASDELKGSFNVISDKLGFNDKDVPGHFLKYELCEEVMRYYNIKDSKILLVENDATKKLYLMNSYVLKSMNEEKEKIKKDDAELKMIDGFMQSMGYKTSQIDGAIYVKTKHYRILCNQSTVNVLQKDKEYLQQVDAWFEQRQVIRKQLLSLLPKLKYYVQLYAVQRSRMSKTDILTWTTLTKSAIILNDKEVDYLVNKLFGHSDMHGVEEKQNKVISEVGDYIYTSRGILGL